MAAAAGGGHPGGCYERTSLNVRTPLAQKLLTYFLMGLWYYPYCQFKYLKRNTIGDMTNNILRDQLHTFSIQNGFKYVQVLTVRQSGNHYYLDARSHPNGSPPKVYGVIESVDGSGLYVPVGRQSRGKGLYLEHIPICVGGGREMELTNTGLEFETGRQVVTREAQEELGQLLNIASASPLVTGLEPRARYLRIRLAVNPPYEQWDLGGESDQVLSVRLWKLPDGLTRIGNLANPLLALRMFDELGCTAHRAEWGREWHALGYQAALWNLLGSPPLPPLRTEPLPPYVYGNIYSPYDPTTFKGHRKSCDGKCRFPVNIP